MRRLILASSIALLAACGGVSFGAGTPVTKLDPPPGPFNDKVTVTLTSDIEATIFATVDGTDPREDKGKRLSGESKLSIELTRSTTLNFYATNGNDETVRSVQYIRAGGKKGSISGVVVVDSVAVGKALQLVVDGNAQELTPLTQPGEIPFTITDLETGRHRVQAIADRNADGNFVPFLDLSSELYTADLDLGDPFKASAEKVRLFLGAADEGLCTIAGTVKMPAAQPGEVVRISALSPTAFTDAAQDPTVLLAQLQQGDQLLMQEGTESYPYAIQNLEPGAYLPVPALTTFGLGGIGLHFMGNPLSPVRCDSGEVVRKNFEFGPVAVSGSIELPAPETGGALGGITLGVAAAKRISLSDGIQALLMPVLLRPTEADPARLSGNYTGRGLKTSAQYQLRVFTGAQGIAQALAWVVNPLAGDPPQAQISTGRDDLTLDIVVP